MPSYDYRCNTCKRRLVLTFKTYADYDQAAKSCPHCQSTSLTRLISRVALGKSEEQRFGDLSDDSAMDDMANADPATLGRYMRRMGQEAGEDLGDEFNEVVGRLESGESPEDIESSLPEPASGGSDGPSSSTNIVLTIE